MGPRDTSEWMPKGLREPRESSMAPGAFIVQNGKGPGFLPDLPEPCDDVVQRRRPTSPARGRPFRFRRRGEVIRSRWTTRST